MKRFIFFALLLSVATGTHAQKISDAEKKAVIDSLIAKVNALYVYEAVAQKMATAIRQRQRDKSYDSITTRQSMAAALTRDLRATSNDGHLGVEATEAPIVEEKPEAPSEDAANQFRKTWAKHNFNIKKLEYLEGNIGLLQIDTFFPADWIKDLVQSIAVFFEHADAIIIDIRRNHGFSDGGFLLASYFFKESVHWNDVYDRDAKSVKQFWTLPAVAGPKLADKDLYILTSKDVFSAPEDFAYNLQALGRAKIVGETTGGGAHPTKPYKIGAYFLASIPFAYGVNPITQSDWEGKGVQPDVAVPAAKALLTAHLLALKAQLTKAGSDKERAGQLEKTITIKEAELRQVP